MMTSNARVLDRFYHPSNPDTCLDSPDGIISPILWESNVRFIHVIVVSKIHNLLKDNVCATKQRRTFAFVMLQNPLTSRFLCFV